MSVKDIFANFSNYLFNNEDAYLYYDDDDEDDDTATAGLTVSEQYVIIFVLVAIFVVGMAANSKLLYLSYVHARNGLFIWIYVLNITVVHFLMLMTSLPASAVTVKLTSWPFGNILCKINNYLMTVCLAVDVLSLVAMAVDNYFLIRSGFAQTFRSRKNVTLVLVCVWCVSLISMTPRLSLYHDEQLLLVQETHHVCTRNSGPITRRRADTCVLFFTLYVTPALVITSCLFGSQRKLTTVLHSDPENLWAQNEVREGRQSIRMCAMFGVTYLVGWLPVHMASFVQEFYEYEVFGGREVYALCVFLATFAICPIIVWFAFRNETNGEQHEFTSLQVLGEDTSSSHSSP